MLILQNLIDKAVLDVDPTGQRPFQVPHQNLIGWRILKGIDGEDGQKPFRICAQSRCRQLLCILLGLFSVNESPAHHASSVEHSETGVFMPSTMESASPGKEFK